MRHGFFSIDEGRGNGMNILYIAYSCDPYRGSEDKIGWNVPIESAKTNHVYVITKEEQRQCIEAYMSTHKIDNIEFYYVDIPKFYKQIFKGFMYSGRLNIWHRCVFSLTKKICIEKHIDIIHQITPVEFRAIGNYGKIKGAKFVCGPLGGGEFIPQGLKYYSRQHTFVESVRTVANYLHRLNIKLSGKLADCDYIMFANKETEHFLTDKLKFTCSYNLVTDIGVQEDELLATGTENFRQDEDQKMSDRCIFLAAGRMIYRKGYEFLLDALERVSGDLDYQCRIIGSGPELEGLQKRCEDSEELSRHVIFTNMIPYEQMEKEYQGADVFVMPSIRETTGTVLLEAMSQGLPIITVNRFGGATLLDDNIGWLYDGVDRDSFIEKLKNDVEYCIMNRGEVKRRGQKARKKAEQYTWENKNQFYQKIYRNLEE